MPNTGPELASNSRLDRCKPTLAATSQVRCRFVCPLSALLSDALGVASRRIHRPDIEGTLRSRKTRAPTRQFAQGCRRSSSNRTTTGLTSADATLWRLFTVDLVEGVVGKLDGTGSSQCLGHRLRGLSSRQQLSAGGTPLPADSTLPTSKL